MHTCINDIWICCSPFSRAQDHCNKTIFSTLSTTTLQTRSKQNQEFNIETGEIQFRVSVQHLELISEILENNIFEHLNAPHDT